MRIPVCRNVSTAAQVQNARSSSPDRSRRLPVRRVLGPDPCRYRRCSDVNPAERDAGEGERRAGRDAVRGRQAGCGGGARVVDRATSTGRTGSRSRVRWSIRDLRDRISFCRARSSARIGHGAAHGAHRDGSSIAHWAMSR